MTSIKVKVIKNNFAKIANATVTDVAQALFVEAERIMTDAKQNYVPVDTGALMGSGTVLKPEITGRRISVTLGFGGAAAPYAAVVHEYPKKYGQHKNKYLSQPLNKANKDMAIRLSQAVKNSIKNRGA